MKRLCASLIAVAVLVTLVPPSASSDPWDRQINHPTRFKVLADFGGSAVLDKETGLVWERSPGSDQFEWITAQAHCNLKNVGDRKGWRLPAIQELASLVDPTIAPPGPTLPPGHPFTNIQTLGTGAPLSSSAYWSANTWSADPTVAWDVTFNTGVVANTQKVVLHYVWCVRTGAGVDVQ
jgi:hypothetical protein